MVARLRWQRRRRLSERPVVAVRPQTALVAQQVRVAFDFRLGDIKGLKPV